MVVFKYSVGILALITSGEMQSIHQELCRYRCTTPHQLERSHLLAKKLRYKAEASASLTSYSRRVAHTW
jgi:hypothetical protein